jgi:hypothetical protein
MDEDKKITQQSDQNSSFKVISQQIDAADFMNNVTEGYYSRVDVAADARRGP